MHYVSDWNMYKLQNATWNVFQIYVYLNPKYFFRLNKSLHLFEMCCTFLN